MQAVKQRIPRALLQFEDFKKGTAFKLLDRYRTQICSFNDDIQGTAAIAAAAMMAGARVSGIPLTEQRAVVLGADPPVSLTRQILVDHGNLPIWPNGLFYFAQKSSQCLGRDMR